MSEAGENTQKSRRRAAKAAGWLTAACEPLEHRRLLSGYGPLVSVASFNVHPNGLNPQAAVTFDASGNLWGTTGTGGLYGDGTVFEIANGGSTITTIASFNGTNGANSYAGVTFDTSGNLWGTTYNGGSSSVGTVFEITKGSSTITSVASFNTSNGAHPMASVTFDASGNLWGTTYNGGSGAGTIFEIAKGSTTITTTTIFNGYDGSNPESAVTFDASGNLWVTTQYGGAYYSGGASGYGTVFELYKAGNSVSLFNNPHGGTSGVNPEAAITFDSGGNLWGTTYGGGSSNDGTVFEVANGSNTITTVANLNSSTGINPLAALTFDVSGNLWGTTSSGGSSNDGTVLEIGNGSSSITNVASFIGTNGGSSRAAVTFDGSGNLWGTTYSGGFANVGTVFEIARGGTTISTVVSFIGTNGLHPDAAVTFDASGNLWGTTYQGGTNNDGTVYEIVKGTNTITTVASFNGTNGNQPMDAVTFDASGNLFGTTEYGGGTNGEGTVFEIANGSSVISTVAVFSRSNGVFPYTAVTFDAIGNLWGTTSGSPGLASGTVYEIAKGSSTISTVATFDASLSPFSAVTFDASGNLWGTTYQGGANFDGTVYEIVKGSTTVTSVATFNRLNGAGPYAPVTFDTSGNLWGTTFSGGTYGYGTFYMIAKGSSTITTVNSFNGSNGKNTYAAVTFDGSGNLWGTTFNGGSGSAGTAFEIAKGSTIITTAANFSGTNGANPSTAVVFDASGNIWGTTNSGGAANAGTIWELSLMPAWLSDPAGNDTWNTASHTLIVNDPSTIIADPGADQPIIEANGSSAVVTINPSRSLQIHLGGLSLTNGASAIVTSLGAARTATNHRLLVLGLPGAASAPLFTIDATSKLDLTDNDLVDHDGSLSSVTSLLASGFAGSWSGDGIVSSKARGSGVYTLGVSQPASAGTFDSETVGTSDDELRYTYYGDANLDGHVDGSDYSLIDLGFITHATGWHNGDFNYDGVIDGSDYALIDNSFNTQGASLAASIAPPTTDAAAASLSKGLAVRLNIGAKASGRSRTALFAPDIFSTDMPIALTESTEQSIEFLIQKRDLLDQLSRDN